VLCDLKNMVSITTPIVDKSAQAKFPGGFPKTLEPIVPVDLKRSCSKLEVLFLTTDRVVAEHVDWIQSCIHWKSTSFRLCREVAVTLREVAYVRVFDMCVCELGKWANPSVAQYCG
jgi:hypothetical protein